MNDRKKLKVGLLLSSLAFITYGIFQMVAEHPCVGLRGGCVNVTRGLGIAWGVVLCLMGGVIFACGLFIRGD